MTYMTLTYVTVLVRWTLSTQALYRHLHRRTDRRQHMRAHHTLAQVGSKIGTDFTIMIHDLNKIFIAQSDLFADSMVFLRVNFTLNC